VLQFEPAQVLKNTVKKAQAHRVGSSFAGTKHLSRACAIFLNTRYHILKSSCSSASVMNVAVVVSRRQGEKGDKI
jgi:hypothetical protein